MPLEIVEVERVAPIQTSRKDVTRYDVYARTPSEVVSTKYSTVDKRLAATCIAAQASHESLEIRWMHHRWGYRIVAARFVEDLDEVSSEALAARMRAQDKADLDAKIGTDVFVDDETVCHTCFKRWERTDVGTYRPPPVWIAEAQAYHHLRCWEARTVAKVEEL